MTLPRHFRDAGYRTYAIGKINDPRNGKLDNAWISNPRSGASRTPSPLGSSCGAWPPTAKTERPISSPSASPPRTARGHPTAKSLAQYKGVDVMREAGPGREMFGGLHPDVHTPNRAGCRAAAKEFQLSDAQVADIVRRYLASVTDVDTMFGQILDAADRLGMLDDTIVIFWSGDHGFSLGDSDQWGKWTNYASATRIPLIMSVPGTHSAGQRAGGLVEAVDMYPTLDELCGLSRPPQALDGLSFAPLFDNPGRPWKKAAFSRLGKKSQERQDRALQPDGGRRVGSGHAVRPARTIPTRTPTSPRRGPTSSRSCGPSWTRDPPRHGQRDRRCSQRAARACASAGLGFRRRRWFGGSGRARGLRRLEPQRGRASFAAGAPADARAGSPLRPKPPVSVLSAR